MPNRQTLTAAGFVALLGGSGILHFVRPKPFVSIVPRSLPHKELLVSLSGAAELGCAALIAAPKTRPIGGIAAAALFVAVFPANVSMSLRSQHKPTWYRIGAWLRLPLQAPLIWAAWDLAHTP